MEVFDQLRGAVRADRSQFFRDFSAPFYGANRKGSTVSQGLRDTFWLQAVQGGLNAIHECIKALSETDFTEDLKKFDVPTLLVHGDDDQIVPIDIGGRRQVKLIRNAKLVVYEGAPHGLASTHKDRTFTDRMGRALAHPAPTETARTRATRPPLAGDARSTPLAPPNASLAPRADVAPDRP